MHGHKTYVLKKDGTATDAFTSEELTCGEAMQYSVVTDITGLDGAPTITMEVKVSDVWVEFGIIAQAIDLTKPKIYEGARLPGQMVRLKYVVGGATVGTYSLYICLK